MKSYKEINDEIEVPQDIKQKTLMALQKEKKTLKRPMYQYVGALFMMFILCGSLVLWNRQHSETAYDANKPNTESAISSEATNKKIFQLSDYVVDDISVNANTTNDIAGSLEPMNDKLRKEVAFAPTQSDVVFPSGFTSSIEFTQYVYEDIGPYANIFYHANKEDKYQFEFTIQDNRMPSCLRFDMNEASSLNEYNGYRIAITYGRDENGVECYWVYASRDDFIIEGYAMVEKEEDLTNFLISFLI